MKPAARRASAAGATRKGLSHRQNEDAWCVVVDDGEGSPRGELFAVSDGVSTTEDASWASRLTCERLGQFFDSAGELGADDLLQLVGEIDWELRGRGKGKAACTLAALWLTDGEARAISVGDSVIFRVRDGVIERLSRKSARKRQLDTFMGMGPDVSERLSVDKVEVSGGDAFILVTDGVSEVLSPEELSEWWKVTAGDPDRCADGLVREVGRRRGRDDATVVVVRVH